jgi:RNA polymerase sigma-70 factor (ECF subfamily)
MLSEEKLIQGCINGDRRCQQQMYERFYGKMMVVCMRYAKDDDAALDAFQEAFIKVFNNLEAYQGNGSFEGWVRRIMVNTSIDHLRKNKRLNEMYVVNEEITVDETQDEPTVDDVQTLSFQELMKYIQQLSPAYRSVFNMYVIDGFTHQEIADELGISVGTSKSNLNKAKRNLKKILSEDGVTEENVNALGR